MNFYFCIHVLIIVVQVATNASSENAVSKTAAGKSEYEVFKRKHLKFYILEYVDSSTKLLLMCQDDDFWRWCLMTKFVFSTKFLQQAMKENKKRCEKQGVRCLQAIAGCQEAKHKIKNLGKYGQSEIFLWAAERDLHRVYTYVIQGFDQKTVNAFFFKGCVSGVASAG